MPPNQLVGDAAQSQERPGRAAVPGQLVLYLKDETFTVCSPHSVPGDVWMRSFGVLCSNLIIPRPTGDEQLPEEPAQSCSPPSSFCRHRPLFPTGCK